MSKSNDLMKEAQSMMGNLKNPEQMAKQMNRSIIYYQRVRESPH